MPLYNSSSAANLQTETQDYLARITAASGKIDAATLNAIDKFIVRGKADGWFSLLNYIAPFCGNNLASALILLKGPSGVAFTSTSFTDADFDQAKGLTATSGKYLATGYVPSAQGLSVTNFSMAVCRVQQDRGNTQVFVSSIPTAGEGSPMMDFSTIGITRSNQVQSASQGMRCVVLNGGSSSGAGFCDGVKGFYKSSALTASGSNTLQFEITVFRGKLPDGNIYNTTGTIGFLAFGTSLTDAQALSLNRAMMQLMVEVRTAMSKRGVTFSVLGDSNGAAWQSSPTWANLLTQEFGWREINNAQTGSYLNSDSSGAGISGVNRSTQILDVNPELCFIALGTNDTLNDGQTNGNSTTTSSLTTNLNSICTNLKNKYIKPFILGIPYSTSINATKGALYTAAAASAAKTSSVPFVDLYNLLNDNASPSSYLTDGIHFNATGYELVANAIKERLQGRMFRRPTLDFGSIAAGASADLTVTVYNAVAGMGVNVAPPSTLETGLVATGFVSANDTVTVRLTNTTGGAIDPASAQYRVTVFTNY